MTIFQNPPAAKILPDDYTVDTLPAPDDYIGYYARVTDLFGGKRDLVLASSYGALKFWQPVRPDFSLTVTLNSNMTVFPLKSPNMIIGNGSIGLGVTRNVTLSTVGGWPGARFTMKPIWPDCWATSMCWVLALARA